MENKDAKLGKYFIIGIAVLFVILVLLSQYINPLIFALMYSTSIHTPTQYGGLSSFQIINIAVCVSFFSLFSYFGYRKAKQKGLNPFFWAVICFIFNFWGYVALLFSKNEKSEIKNEKSGID